MLLFELGLLLALTLSALTCFFWALPTPFEDQEVDVLIICAHSDDCVISASEYAYGAMQLGRSIKIAYLTCSGDSTTDEQSLNRKAEAFAAWSQIGVPRESFTFLDLKQSPVGGLQSYSHSELRTAAETLKILIAELPEHAALIIPAAGETHVDHRNVRTVSLIAVAGSERQDLKIYETPEYNQFLSMIHCPLRTVVTVCRFLPFAGRIISPYRGSCNFTSGGSPSVFLDTPERLALKKKLLTYFHSQDPPLLLEFFGYPSLYRQFSPSRAILVKKEDEDILRRGVAFLGYRWDWSALTFALAMLVLVLVTSFEAANIIRELLPREIVRKAYPILLANAVIALYALRWIRSSSSLATCAVAWTASLGFLINAALLW